MSTAEQTTMESVESFRERAAAWIPEHLPKIGASGGDDPITRRLREQDLDPDNYLLRTKALQGIIYDGGFAGVAYPKEYGGQGLTARHMHAFNAECKGYDLSGLGAYGMTFGMIGPTILEFGTEEQKERHIRGFLSGENIWIQFLSEPTGGSDLASVLTRADRDGDEWVINGSKIWTSLGETGDYGLLVARTNWDVPKHSGISVFMCPVHTPGLEVMPLRLVTGATGFCQEFFTDVRIPADHLLGTLNDGWTVASRLLVHERNSVGGGSQYWAQPFSGMQEAGMGGEPAPVEGRGPRRDDLVELADANGKAEDPYTRQLVAEAYVAAKVGSHLGPRVAQGMGKGVLPPAAGSFLKLFNSSNQVRRSDISMVIAGTPATVWETDDRRSEGRGLGYLFRQAGSILSGTSEIQRNIISERVLGLPREPSLDTKVPFNQVRHNTMPTGTEN
ncbi:MAG TPA: acyl-CoA dehydrogenase family protein [Acidimicrobiia bacterium]|nr:acyl-CoA dehydrogenase family protein [Acidimicrobiia bacterium]